MRWEDERYVRLYTRDTLTWRQLGWWGQCCLALLMRKVDRAGVMEMGDLSPAESLQLATELPDEVVAEGWKRLAKTKTVLVREATETLPRALVLPNFLEAQEARSSDKARQQKSRDLARVTKRDDASQGVTNSHTASHGVTPSLAVPSLAVDLKSLVEPSSTGPAEQVFQEWVSVHGKKQAKFTAKRRRRVVAALKIYPIERLLAAIRGCKRSPHHQGQNQTATKYDDLELICRDGEHVEMFEGFNPKVAVLPPPPTKEEEEARWKSTMAEAEREMQSSKLRPRSISSGGE